MGECIVMSNINYQLLESARRHADALARLWLPNGRLQGRNWLVGSVKGEAGDSLSVNLDKGVWNDFADPTSKGGDMIGLCRAVFNLDFREACERIRQDLQALGCEITARTGPEPVDAPTAMLPVPDGVLPPPLDIGTPQSVREPNWRLKQRWAYSDEQGRLMFYVVRYDESTGDSSKGKPKKRIIPCCYFGPELGWKFKGPGLRKNPLYRLPDLDSDSERPVLIVEGEKACDAAVSLFPDYACVSWMGGSGQLRKADFSPLAGRHVVYWPDADTPGLASIPQFIDLARLAEFASLRVVDLPPHLPSAWDLADPIPDGIDIRHMIETAEPIDLRSVKSLAALTGPELVERLIYNVGTEQFIDPPSQLRLDAPQIDAMFRHVVEGRSRMSAILLANPKLRKVVALTYRPGQPDQIVSDAFSNRLLNTWRPSRIETVAGDAHLFEAHLRYLCPTEAEHELLADALAFMIQRPGEKLKFAPVLVGRQGTGKSAVASIMRRLLGEHNTTVASTSEIRSDFNEWVAEKQLVVIEEIMALGRIEVMNTLKPLITEPILSVNKKYVRRYEIENVANFIFLTNHKDALKLDDDDRRYFVVVSDRAPNHQNYYRALFEWAYANLGAIRHWLESRDLSAFDPNRRPPMTAGKSQMIELSKDPRQQVIEQLILDCEPPFEHDLIELPKAHAFLIGRSGPLGGASLPRSFLMKILEGGGARMLGQQKATIRGVVERRSLWVIRNSERYATLSQQEIVAIYLGYKLGEDRPF